MATVKELDLFLSEYATSTLRAAGFRKSHQGYWLQAPNRDQALMHFRGYPLPDTMGSFLLGLKVLLEPDWDLQYFDPGRSRAYPHRPYDVIGTFTWSAYPSLDPLQHWEYSTTAERDQIGQRLRQSLQTELIPAVRELMDHEKVLAAARAGEKLHGQIVSEQTYRSLLVAAGESAELEAVLEKAQATDSAADQRFTEWASVRLFDGPAWNRAVRPAD